MKELPKTYDPGDSEDEIYKGVLKFIELGHSLENMGDLIGEKGLKVEVSKEVNNNG